MKGGVYKDTKGYRVKYPVKGSKPIQKRFGQDLFAAERFLNGLRWKEDNNELDPRDYQAGNPMGFTNISNAYLKLRKNQVRCFRLLEHHIEDAQNFFGNKNIKHIQYADLEDLFIQIQASRSLTSKTIYNIRTTLHALFVWAAKKFKIDMPEFPSIKVNLGWRATVDKTTQRLLSIKFERSHGMLTQRSGWGSSGLALIMKSGPLSWFMSRKKTLIIIPAP